MFNSASERDLPAVLLIDDDLVSREVMATVLTMGGYLVHTAESGEAALKALGQCAPGVILMDAKMPGLSGNGLIGVLRAVSEAEIFVVSASRPSEEIIQAADGFLLKPFGAAELGKALKEHESQAAASASTASASSYPDVNPATLAQLRGLMPEAGVRQIYAAIVADLARRTTAIEEALARGDDSEVRRIGHAIKGGCSMAGALRAAHLGEQIESGLLDNGINQLDNKNRLLQDLRDAAVGLQRMLEAEFPC